VAFAYGKAAEIMERTYNINNGMDPDTVTPINPYDLDLMYDHKFNSVHSADSLFFSRIRRRAAYLCINRERISRPLTSSTPHSEPSCEWLRYRKLGFLQVKEHLTTRPTQDKNKETYPSPLA